MSIIRILKSKKVLRPRDPYDFYPTPSGVIRSFLGELATRYTPRVIVDHSAGTGVWGAVARQIWPTAQIIGIEIQPSRHPAAYDVWYSEWSFFAYALAAFHENAPRPDLIMGNPPFKYAEEFTRLSLLMLQPGGRLVHYLRLAFLEGQDRGTYLWPTLGPVTVDTLSRRPSHIPGTTKTDSTAYAVYTWEKGNHPARYSGGWVDWTYEPRIPEEYVASPIRYIEDTHEQAPGLHISNTRRRRGRQVPRDALASNTWDQTSGETPSGEEG